MGRLIFDVCKHSSDPIDRIGHDWLRVLEAFMAMVRSTNVDNAAENDDLLRVWRAFRKRLHVDSEAVRHKENKSKTLGRGLLPGCGWYKCPLHGSPAESSREMMLCSQCKTVSLHTLGSPRRSHFVWQVQYCSMHCQRRYAGSVGFAAPAANRIAGPGKTGAILVHVDLQESDPGCLLNCASGAMGMVSDCSTIPRQVTPHRQFKSLSRRLLGCAASHALSHIFVSLMNVCHLSLLLK